MNVGEFIQKLDSLEKTSKVVIKYKDRKYYFKLVSYHNMREDLRLDNYPDFFHSYRGYYKDIAIAIGKKETNYTVEDLLSAAKNSIGFSFEGYKGGLFTMNKDSRFWVSKCGDNSSYRCSDVTQNFGIATIYINKRCT